MSTKVSFAPGPIAFGELAKLPRSLNTDDVAALVFVIVGLAIHLLRGIVWDKPDPLHHLWFQRRQEEGEGFKQQARKKTRDVAKKLEETHKDVVVFWGSQSGTAESFANRLGRDLHNRFRLGILVADISDFDPQSIASIPPAKKVIFMLATYGEGDPSDNTAAFWDWIKSTKLGLSGLQYAAFGLGDSNYKYYNRVIDVITQALDKGGANAFLPVGRADGSKGGTEEDFMVWREQLFSVFRNTLGYKEYDPTYEPTIAILEDEPTSRIHVGVPLAQKASTPIRAVPVKVSRDLCPRSSRHRLHMEVDLSAHHEMQYKTGDHLSVWPMNPDVEVERLLDVLGRKEKKDIPISVQTLDSSAKATIPTPSSLHALFNHYLAICAPISRDTIQSLVRFAPDHIAEDFLRKIGQDKDSHADFLNKQLNLGQLLELTASSDIGWDKLPLSWVLESLPSIHPRLYSISSSSVVQPRQAAITVVVSNREHQQDAQSHAFGLSTNYLLALQKSLVVEKEGGPQPHPHGLTYALDGPNHLLQGGKLFAQVKKSKFRLPQASACPIVMIAAGTGLAPFRGFLQERARLKSIGLNVGRMTLFFGCRRPEEDFLYREELEDLAQVIEGTFEMVTAFSRHDCKADGSKMYVQDRIAERSTEICRQLMGTNCCFYICGSANMAREVVRRIGEALKLFNAWDDRQLRDFMAKIRTLRRWQEDVWD